MSSNLIVERISKLRNIMAAQKIDVYVVCTGDYHMSEYTGDYFHEREFASGFTGSAGTLVITHKKAALFTDGRYYVQAAKELCGTTIELMKSGCDGVPSVEEYCLRELSDGDVIGLDGRTVSADFGCRLELNARKKNSAVRYDFNAIEQIWKDRPAFPSSKAFFAGVGETRQDKLKRVRSFMKALGADAHIIATLDDICWLLNIRGRDVACNPVVMSYMLITQEKAFLFIDEEKAADVKKDLESDKIELLPYNDIYEICAGLGEHNLRTVLADKKRINYLLYKSITAQESCGVSFIDKQNPTVLMKAVKNIDELENLKAVHIDDGLAVTRFIYWVKNAVRAGDRITEVQAAEYMDSLRAQISDFIETSFDTISAYGPNAAMMHYKATDKNCALLEPAGMLLLDSGGQYMRGTTDVTRTIALGDVTSQMKRHFTLTLKGMLALSNAVFLQGCTGQNLDILARGALWNEGIDYRCGTGHGVGYLLSVHEPPNNFRWKQNTANTDMCVLEPGMVTSDEPGVYIEGEYGIRIENEIVCVKNFENEYGTFLKFDTLTCVPVDRELIDTDLLDDMDKKRLNEYHRAVYEKLSVHMEGDELEYLKKACEPV